MKYLYSSQLSNRRKVSCSRQEAGTTRHDPHAPRTKGRRSRRRRPQRERLGRVAVRAPLLQIMRGRRGSFRIVYNFSSGSSARPDKKPSSSAAPDSCRVSFGLICATRDKASEMHLQPSCSIAGSRKCPSDLKKAMLHIT